MRNHYIVYFTFALVLFISQVANSSKDDGGGGGCQLKCSKEKDPVCAECSGQLRNFTNPCLVKRENVCYGRKCKVINHGYCGRKGCPMACTYEYDPKCSWNGKKFKTFSNPCFQRAHNNCNNNGDNYYRTVASCPCEEKSNRH